jgi:hypothetical protein
MMGTKIAIPDGYLVEHRDFCSVRLAIHGTTYCQRCFTHTTYESVWFEVLTAVVMKSTIFWDITPCSPLSVNRRFGGTCRTHLQGQKMLVRWARNQREILPPAFTLVSCSPYFFDPEDGGDIFLRNVGWHSTDYTTLYPRRWYSSIYESHSRTLNTHSCINADDWTHALMTFQTVNKLLKQKILPDIFPIHNPLLFIPYNIWKCTDKSPWLEHMK